MAAAAAGSANTALLGAKLGALVRDVAGDGTDDINGAAGGAAVVRDGEAFVLASQESGVRGLGPALLWAVKNEVERLVVFSDGNAGDLARRASLLPAINTTVRRVMDASSEVAIETELLLPPSLSPEVLDMADSFAEAGAVPVDDFAKLVAEVSGLEVARAFSDDAGELIVEIGVGQADRELHQLVHTNMVPVDAITRAAEVVRQIRTPGAPPHPLSRVGRSRWLRSAAVADPSLVDVGSLRPVPPLRARDTVLGIEPACAVSDSAVVVFSAGVDPDLVPEALDYRSRENPSAELVFVMIERDVLPTTARLIDMCPNSRLFTTSSPWS